MDSSNRISAVQMRDLADAGDVPTVFMMQGVADLTFDHPARVSAADGLETEWAAMVFHNRKLEPGPATSTAARFGADRQVGCRDGLDRPILPPAGGARSPPYPDRGFRWSQTVSQGELGPFPC